MLRVLASGASGQPVELAQAWRVTLQPYRASPMGLDGHMGLLWAQETWNGRVLHSKTGQTSGFCALVMMSTSPQAAVVLLANSAELLDAGVLRRSGLSVLSGLP